MLGKQRVEKGAGMFHNIPQYILMAIPAGTGEVLSLQRICQGYDLGHHGYFPTNLSEEARSIKILMMVKNDILQV
jgi:hypothetical protein